MLASLLPLFVASRDWFGWLHIAPVSAGLNFVFPLLFSASFAFHQQWLG
jgi:hypothetical protein